MYVQNTNLAILFFIWNSPVGGKLTWRLQTADQIPLKEDECQTGSERITKAMKSDISHGTDATIRSMIQSTKTSPGKNKSQKQQIPLQ